MPLLSPAARHEALARSKLFQAMTPKELSELAALTRERSLAASDEIFHKGSAGSDFYVLVSGRVRIESPSPDGRDLTLRTLGPGEVLGEIAIFDRRPRSATARAIEGAVMLVFDNRDFRAYLERRPGVALKLLEVFAQRLRDTTEQLEDNVFLTIEGRLAKVLLGMVEEGGEPVTPPITQVQLAKMIGTVRERVNKQLAAWERAGAIRRLEGRIEILDAEQLEASLPFGPD